DYRRGRASALNLFLYRLAPRAVLQDARATLKLPPGSIGFDLFYLLTAYGAKDYTAETLLGYGVQAFCQTPMLTPDDVRKRIKTAKNKTIEKAEVSAHNLTITPSFMSLDDMSKIWSSLQAKYRPSVAYQVSPLIISP
ncbi:MAG: DUF4255 domain-containing protein, partial [Anaerolineae bacterium]|nr:DUF4255 domain-containing protein [Anaerolineae bacterium]